jgi:hypothetical protein
MDLVVYLVRSPLETISPSLYSKTEDIAVIAVGKAPVAGKILERATSCSQEKGATLSYGELLEVLLGSQRVITL